MGSGDCQTVLSVGGPMIEALRQKLHPNRFPYMSGKMAAILGYLLDQEWTDEVITDMMVTSDGEVLSQNKGDVGMNYFIGSNSDLQDNLTRLIGLPEVGLTKAEKMAMWHLVVDKIRRS
jgi:hypothetical protein